MKRRMLAVVVAVIALLLVGCSDRDEANARCINSGGKWTEAPAGWACE